MRALTITLRALAAKVGLRKEFAILNQEGTVINRIQARIRERTEKLKAKKKKSLKALAMYEGLTELSLNLELVKETYRNTSFHSRRSYKPPEAFIVSTAVGAIMNMAVKAGVAERRAKKERKSGKP